MYCFVSLTTQKHKSCRNLKSCSKSHVLSLVDRLVASLLDIHVPVEEDYELTKN